MSKLTKTKVTEAITRFYGNVSACARTLNVSRPTLYRYIDKNNLASLLTEERERMVDNVESKLYSQAMEGNTVAMIFFLKTQGKHRGYTERQEFTGANGAAMNVVLKWADENNEVDNDNTT